MRSAHSLKVGWTRSGRVRVSDFDGCITDTDRDTFFKNICIPYGSVVYVRYDAGPEIIDRLTTLKVVGHLTEVYVRSGRGHRTSINRVTAKTVKVWANGPAHLITHPVALAMHPFAPGGDGGCMASVIARIFDPRWYFHPLRPNRWSMVEAAMGLEPRYDKTVRGWRSTIIGCWLGGNGPSQAENDFYGRYYSALLETTGDTHKAVRKTSRHFIKAMMAAWLDSYILENGQTRGERMFDPYTLFDNTALEANGYPLKDKK